MSLFDNTMTIVLAHRISTLNLLQTSQKTLVEMAQEPSRDAATLERFSAHMGLTAYLTGAALAGVIELDPLATSLGSRYTSKN